MNSQDLRALQEAYIDVYQLDEDKRPIYGRGGAIRKTETPLQIYGKQATAKDKRTKHNIPKGGTTIDRRDSDELFSGDYDRGSGNAAKRRAAALTKPEAKKFPNRLTRSDKQGIKDSFDLYDIILSHLLDEGYAETLEQAEVIMVNMSEDWRESICEAEVLAQKGGVPGSVQVNKTREGGFLGIGSKEVSKPVSGSFKAKDVSSKDAARYNTGIDKKFGSSDNIDNTSAANVQHAARNAGNSGYMKVKDPGSLPNTGIPNRPTPGRASDQNQARQMSGDIVRMNRNRIREGSFDNLIDTGAKVIKKPVQDYANKKVGGLAGALGIPGAVAGQKVDQTATDLKKGNYGKALNTVVGGVRTLTQSYDLYDIILSHLLDEGYAETQEQAEVIMVNMSEDWRESIMEAMKPLPVGKMLKQAARHSNPEQVTKMAKVADEHDPKKSKRKEDDNRREGGRKRDAGRPSRNELQDNW